jgi:5'-methylthioadenosine phosphorylase
MTFTDVRIGVIGGSGLYQLDHLAVLGHVKPLTPWGYPSDDIVICQTASGGKIAFLSRHGRGHTLSPSHVPYQANIAALKHIGVQVIVAFSAVGSLQEAIAPRDFVIPTQLIDRTKGVRPSTFFESVVGHAMFADPFTPELTKLAHQASSKVVKTHMDKTLICMEGPAFSTRAESNLYRSWGADVINMSAIPEAKLAAEAEIPYTMICMATDYDCWKTTEEPVTVEAVIANLSANSENAANVLKHLIPSLEQGLEDKMACLYDKIGTGKYAIITKRSLISAKDVEKIQFILPDF